MGSLRSPVREAGASSDHRMDRCWLQGALGDLRRSIGFAGSYKLRWLLRAIARLGTAAFLFRLLQATLLLQRTIGRSYRTIGSSWLVGGHNWIGIVVVKNRFLDLGAQGAF